MKKHLHILLVFIMVPLMGNLSAQIMDADYFNFTTSVTGDWSYTNAGTVTFAEVSEDLTSASSGKCMKFAVKHDMTTADKKQVATSNINKGGTLTLEEGKSYKLSLRVYLEDAADKAYFTKISCAMKKSSGDNGYMNFPALIVPTSAKGMWQELESGFVYNGTDNTADQLVSSVLVMNLNQSTLTGSIDGLMYIDDIVIEEVIPDEIINVYVEDDVATPLESVNVTVNGETFTTAANGIAEVSVPQGLHTFVTTKNAYAMDIREVNVQSSSQINITLNAAQSAQIVLTAKNTAGNNLSSTMVIAKDENENVVLAKETNNGGKVWISGLEEGIYTYEIFGSETLRGVVNFTGRNRNLLVNEGEYNLNLAVVDATTGIDIEDATFVLTDPSVNELNMVQNKAEFVFQGADLTPGTYTYTVNAAGYKEKVGTLEVDDLLNIDINYVRLETTSTDISKPSVDLYKVYPNPATSIVNVVAPLGSVVSFYSISGNKAKVINITSELATISVTDLAKGFYLVEILSEGSKVIEKIQIQ